MRGPALALALVACGGASGGSPADGALVPDAAPGTLERVLTARCAEDAILGATATVRAPDGTRAHARCGHADRARTRPVVDRDRFRIGSNTKSFTAALVLALADDGVLALDAPVDALGLPLEGADVITLRQLLSHTSGVFNYTSDPRFDWDRDWTADELLAWVAEAHEPAFAPGTTFGYSNTGYVALGQAVGAEGRVGYPVALRTRLLDPLGLADTLLEGAEPLPGGRVEGARRGGDAPGGSDDWWSSDGSLVSTSDDLVTWLEALALTEGGVVSEAARVTQLGPTHLGDGTEVRAFGSTGGMGVFRADDPAGAIYWHAGQDFGFTAYMAVQPATGRALAVVTSAEDLDISTLGDTLWRATDGAPTVGASW